MVKDLPEIAGSILSADLLRLGDDVADALEAGCKIVHFDVMDFNFVPNLTFGPAFLKALRKRFPAAIFDVHLMIEPVTEEKIRAFAAAGANWISFHPEAGIHLDRTLGLIRELGVRAGLALNPGTGPEVLDYLYDKLDFVLIMSVNPGFGGQKLIPVTLEKAARIRDRIRELGAETFLEIDGGIDPRTIRGAYDAGVRVFVAGSAFFGQPDRKVALKALLDPLGAR